MPNLGPPEILLILVVVIIIFGAGRLPQVLSQLGKGVNEFRKAASGEDKDAVAKTTTTTSERKP